MNKLHSPNPPPHDSAPPTTMSYTPLDSPPRDPAEHEYEIKSRNGTSTTDKKISGFNVHEDMNTWELLQMAQAAGKMPVTISGDLLASLLTSIEGLRTNVDRFCGDNEALRNTLGTKFNTPTTTFHPFPRLPTELRIAIWKKGLSTPRVIGVEFLCKIVPGCWYIHNQWSYIPIATRNPVHQACQESQAEALKLQVPLERHSPEDPIIHVNLEVDIVWVLDRMGTQHSFHQGFYLGLSHMRSWLPQSQQQLPTIAFNHHLWTLMTAQDHELVDTMECLSQYGTKEVIVVVGNTTAGLSGNATFIEPRSNPSELLLPSYLTVTGGDTRSLVRTWSDFSEEQIKRAKVIQTERDEDRKRMRIIGDDPDSADYSDSCQDLWHWTVEKINFMEAATYDELERFRKA